MKRLDRLYEIGTKRKRNVVGLMSGTSVDAIDAVLVEITGHASRARIRELRFDSFPFPAEIRSRVNTLFDKEKANIEEICHLDFVLGELFAAAANKVIANAGMKNGQVDLIAAAGQTIWHRPRPTAEPSTTTVDWIDEPISTRSTLAIGQSAVIAERTGIVTVGDLRVRDVAAGGHGAPLVAYFDWAQARHGTLARAMQNIGGIANVTYVPPKAKMNDVMAFDTGPGNMVIDALTYIVSGESETYDLDGARAARGSVREDVLAWCMADPYFQLKPPKTTGRERFGRQYARRMAEQFREVDPDDLIATATAFTAESIAHAYRTFIDRRIDELLVAGGGAKNPTLMQMLRERLPETNVEVYKFSKQKEAMAMALIANDSVAGMYTDVARLVGGTPAVLGKICL
ncbi:MAG TPA: anhydro-N-acetylmuramic acid kinase [Thermoanaerobaculia bacterium]|nr:anhydro-N-acetylmuramic acid kinase [Thermoanaerobaculia bacterium]